MSDKALKVNNDISKQLERVVPKKEKYQFSIGVFGQNLTYAIVAFYLFYYCTDVLFLDPLYVGLLLGIARFWDAFNDPIVGAFIDNHRFKNGEKLRPFLKATPPIIGVFAMLIFMAPRNSPDVIIFIFILTCMLLWDSLYSFQDIAQWGMTATISPISEERIEVAQIARFAGFAGGWLPGLIPILVANKDKIGISEYTMFLIFGIVFGMCGMLVSMFTYKAQERVISDKPLEPPLKAFIPLFKNKIVMLLLISAILQATVLIVPPIYFFKYKVDFVIAGKHIDWGTAMTIYGVITGFIGTFVIIITDKIAKLLGGMKNLLLVACVSNIIGRVICYFIGFEGANMIIVMVILGVFLIPNSLMLVATTVLWCDSIDLIELQTGKRSEGVAFAAQNFISKAITGLAAIMTGLTLKILKFDATLYDLDLPQGSVFNEWVWLIFILGPALGSLMYIIPLLFIKYSADEKAEVEAELKRRRELANNDKID